MKVIVTGAAGHFGSKLVGDLLHRDIEVIGIDKLLYGGEGLLGSYSHPCFEFQKMDLLQGFTADLDGVDAIVHLAALVGPVCDRSTEAAWATNQGITSSICDAIKQTEIKLILASTCSNIVNLAGTCSQNCDF